MACGINANVYLTQKRQERIDPPLSRPYPCEYPRHEEERPNDKEWDYTDRKSTRLNSSHGYISYAVFCLKKKKKHHISTFPVTIGPLPDSRGCSTGQWHTRTTQSISYAAVSTSFSHCAFLICHIGLECV